MNNEYLKFFKDNSIELTNEQENNLLNLNEVTIIKSDGIYISVDDESNRNFYGFEDIVYFKIYNSENFRKATKFNRIRVNIPDYEKHNVSYGKSFWFLNSKEKKKLINLLNRIIFDKTTNKNISVFNKICDSCKISRIPMPDYYQLPNKFNE